MEYRFAPGTGNELILDESDIVRHNPVKVHTGLSDNSVTFVENRNLDNYAQRQDRVNLVINNTVEWTGFITSTSHSEGSAETTVSLDGIAKRLEETRPDGSVTYSNIKLEDAIDDYWSKTPFGNVTVTSESPTQVATNTTVQSADTQSEWGNISTSIPNTVPVGVVNGELTALQSNFVFEGEAPDTAPASGISAQNSDVFSNNQTAFISSAGEGYSYEFTPSYTIPSTWVGGAIRRNILTGNPDVRVLIAGNEVISPSDWPGGGVALGWQNIPQTDYSGPDLQEGNTYEMRFEAVSPNNDIDELRIDVLSVWDDRYTYTLDNSTTVVNGVGYLDGPELYPNGVTITTDEALTSFNITDVSLNSTWDDTTGAQRIAASLDGSNYLFSDNTTTLNKTFSSQIGRSIDIQYTFDRYGGPLPQTPRFGFLGQSIDAVTVNVSGNDLTVIDELTVSRDHFANLQTLHSYGDFLWVIEHDSSDIANMTVSSFPEGEETRTSLPEFDDPSNQNSGVNGGNYYNSIYIEGAEDAQGNRPSAEIKDQTAINNDNREISPGVLRDPDVTTEAGATFRARSLLNAALSNNDLEGTVTVPPVSGMANPGYAREIDFGSGSQSKTVEEVSFSESPNNVQTIYRFALPNDIAETISALERTQRQLGDRV